jgi:hypothetical protein
MNRVSGDRAVAVDAMAHPEVRNDFKGRGQRPVEVGAQLLKQGKPVASRPVVNPPAAEPSREDVGVLSGAPS